MPTICVPLNSTHRDALQEAGVPMQGPYATEAECNAACEPVIVPGATCDVAGEVPLGYTYSGTILNGTNQWLVVYPGTVSPCKIEWTSTTASLAASFSESYSGDPCVPDLGLGSTTDLAYCGDVTPNNTSSGIMVRVVASGDGNYTFTVSTGSC